MNIISTNNQKVSNGNQDVTVSESDGVRGGYFEAGKMIVQLVWSARRSVCRCTPVRGKRCNAAERAKWTISFPRNTRHRCARED